MLTHLLSLALLVIGLSGLVGLARFEFPTMDAERYPDFLKDYEGRQSLLPGGVAVDPSGFSENENQNKYIPAGTVIGRTATERGNGVGFKEIDTDTKASNADELYLTAHDIQDADDDPEVAVVRHEALIVPENLPDWSSMSSGVQSAVTDRYQIVHE